MTPVPVGVILSLVLHLLEWLFGAENMSDKMGEEDQRLRQMKRRSNPVTVYRMWPLATTAKPYPTEPYYLFDRTELKVGWCSIHGRNGGPS